jgi:hypothetical protein
MLKAAIKHGAGEDQVRHRIVPPEAVSKWVETLEGMKEEVTEILQEEKEEKHVRLGIIFFPPFPDICFSFGKQKWNLKRERT